MAYNICLTPTNCPETESATAAFGVRSKSTPTVKMYNNVVYRHATSARQNGSAASLDIRNNLSVSPQFRHVQSEISPEPYTEDYNGFVPDGTLFKFNSGNYDFAGYRAAHDEDVNGHSHIISTAELVNVSGVFTNAADFSPVWDSPLIDAGTNVGLTCDFFGNPIYGMPDIGAIEYQPPYVMGSDAVDVAGDVRVYGDGKFRNTAAPGGTNVSLVIEPEGGWPSGDTREWMNVSVSNWTVTAMTWTESSQIASNPAHTVGVLPETDYDISVNGTPGYGLTNATIRSDASGVLAFVYTGGYSTNLFEVTASDGDALPDGWETLYLGGTNATEEADPDHDGANNLEEYIAGSDPDDGASVFRISAFSLSSSESDSTPSPAACMRWNGRRI